MVVVSLGVWCIHDLAGTCLFRVSFHIIATWIRRSGVVLEIDCNYNCFMLWITTDLMQEMMCVS